jgi:fructan beta-fructosidase
MTFNEPFRPQIHFSPVRNWMNDPNGLVYFRGRYHLYYQYNPRESRWGTVHWGHAVSEDMLHWDHRPIALSPVEPVGMPMSGCIVVDVADTVGRFGGRPGLVAVYSTETLPADGSRGTQQQCIAMSRDGMKWEPFEGNPVIGNPGVFDFRDPKVFWYAPDREWKMILAAGHQVFFYGSPNLRDWRFLSEFGAETGAHDGEWECPDLVELPVPAGRSGAVNHVGRRSTALWLLTVSVGSVSSPSVLGIQYFLGDFDGRNFSLQAPVTQRSADRARWVDWGHDFYAAHAWFGLPGGADRHVWLAWMNRWSYAEKLPTSPWRGALTIPREVRLTTTGGNIGLSQEPIPAVEGLRVAEDAIEVNPRGTTRLPFPPPFELLVEYSHASATRFTLQLLFPAGTHFLLDIDHAEGELTVNRTSLLPKPVGKPEPLKGTPESPTPEEGVTRVPLPPGTDHPGNLRLLVDRSSVELFCCRGAVTVTERIFPPDGGMTAPAVRIESPRGPRGVQRCVVYPLRSIWRQPRAPDRREERE